MSLGTVFILPICFVSSDPTRSALGQQQPVLSLALELLQTAKSGLSAPKIGRFAGIIMKALSYWNWPRNSSGGPDEFAR